VCVKGSLGTPSRVNVRAVIVLVSGTVLSTMQYTLIAVPVIYHFSIGRCAMKVRNAPVKESVTDLGAPPTNNVVSCLETYSDTQSPKDMIRIRTMTHRRYCSRTVPRTVPFRSTGRRSMSSKPGHTTTH
jgi:hypothetical protein